MIVLHLLLQANSLRIPLANESVQCVVTSPPYWGLRDYGVGDQLGLEATPDEFVAKMVQVFREVRRVLRSDGTCFVNLGDSYAHNGACGGESPDGPRLPRATDKAKQQQMKLRVPDGLKPKDLCGIPWRVALALQADGWYLRSDIIWAKPNPMPESVTDRPTKSHEYVFLLTKNERYYFDQEAVRSPHQTSGEGGFSNKATSKWSQGIGGNGAALTSMVDAKVNPAGRNIRTVWTIPTESYPGAHFATYPRALVEPCIKAGTSQRGCCPECGKGWVREVSATKYEPEVVAIGERFVDESRGDKTRKLSGAEYNRQVKRSTTGWRPACNHGHEPIPCTVFDPFCGSGTTGLVAEGLHRRFVGLDLSREYLGMAKQRINHPHRHVPRPGRQEFHPLFDVQTVEAS